MCDLTGRVAVVESRLVVNLYSCESGPFEHVCELCVSLPGGGPLQDVQLLHPWLACMSDREVLVSYVDIVKRSAVTTTTTTAAAAATTTTTTTTGSGSGGRGGGGNDDDEEEEDDVVDFVFCGVTGRDLLVRSFVRACVCVCVRVRVCVWGGGGEGGGGVAGE